MPVPDRAVDARPAALADAAGAIAGALGEWGLPPATRLDLITESENATFLATGSDGRRRVVRLHRAAYNDAAAIRSEHAWIEALRQDGIVRTPAVLARFDGATVGEARIGEGIRHVAVFEFADGAEPPVDRDLPRWFERLGAITARLHTHSRTWTRPAGFTRRVWDFERSLGSRAHWGDWRAARGLDASGQAVLARAVAAIERALAAYGASPEQFGLIHADLRLANLLAAGDELSVIDFDDCGFGWFMADFAAAISFIEHEPVVPDLQAAWVEGYRSVAPLRRDDAAMLPVFVLLRRILLTAWAASRRDGETASRYGEWYTAGTVELAERFLTQFPKA
ncbi:phosphotransferase enzyme family protein [Aureimonas leprariae]|uniref:Phosphotransferase n=1 Tax=Plantimonas leprariae TaxID=2615207 RepID=A0A7V7U0N9_9HYPH|nr:phosphotransferase [Aureimonas leprariae]KAB0680754.1 phosphotransferase [Aureimonas leprariae]